MKSQLNTLKNQLDKIRIIIEEREEKFNDRSETWLQEN